MPILKTFKIEITGCAVSALWYATRVGQTFNVIDGVYPNEMSYNVVEHGRRKAFHIRKSDSKRVINEKRLTLLQ